MISDVDLGMAEDGNTTIALPSPNDPGSVAAKLLAAYGLGGQLLHWRGDFYRYSGRHWESWSKKEITRWVREATENAVYFSVDKRSGETKPYPWSPTTRKVNEVLEAMIYKAYRDDALESDDYQDGLVSFSNGVFAKHNGRLFEHSSTRFNLHSLSTSFNPIAKCPEWLKFLDSTLDGDPDRILLLQQWFGYIIFGDSRLHKILVLWGAPRSGKGTILRTLTDLLGEKFVTSPRLATIGKEFGLKEFIGKPLATMCDVKWDTLNSNIEEILLTISGGDKIHVNRKYMDPWEGYLPTRIVMASNDMPNFANTSGALGNRMVVLRFLNSFQGREDLGLGDKLKSELAGIFNWALVGWKSLVDGDMKFSRSRICDSAHREILRGASPVMSFLEDKCAKGGSVSLREVYNAYETWRELKRMREASGEPAFSRAIQSAYPPAYPRREGSARAGRQQVIYGIHLAEGDEEWES
jgi:putative DNA primase/helicase